MTKCEKKLPAQFPLLCGVLLVLVGIGCSTTPKIDWDARIGSYTYDQVILELGPPENDAALTDGRRVGDWLVSRGRIHGTIGIGGPVYHSHYYGLWMHQQPISSSPDYYLRLTFSPEGRLQAWQRIRK